jgi:quinol monooxygenase YgiN
MDILIVNILVAEGSADSFIAATRENMAQSRREAGIARFEFLRDQADPRRFVLIEGYRNAEAPARHRESAHYLKWKALIEPMMAKPRTRAQYSEIDPV